MSAGLIGALALAGCDGDPPGTDSGMADGGPGEDAAPAESCSDGVLNQDETDVDCGGTCGATCLVGDMCGDGGDCTTDDCGADGTCQPMPTCSDGVMNDTETDVDCGGAMCAACDTGEACVADTDCMSEICADDDTCAAPMCGDAVVNGTEDCDEGDGTDPVETATCDTDCTTAECGDGIVNATASEECDGDGAGSGGETTSCDTDCTPQVCGDGVTNTTAGEDCDDSGESATCNADCTTSMCGDGELNVTAGEDCDDGNTVDADGCQSDCTIPRVDETISADATFDTDTGELDGAIVAGWNAMTSTWLANNWTLDAGVTLTVTGAAPFSVVADGDVTVNGTIVAAGEDGTGGVACDGDGAAGGLGGPGGHAGGNGGGFGGTGATLDGADGAGPGGGIGGTGDNNGGGGGGHIDRGDSGTAGSSPSSGIPGDGGMFYFTPLMFQGGSGGGGGSVDDDSPLATWDTGDDGGGGGGGGGGAVWIEAAGTVTVTGTIDASGGDGGDDGCDAAAGGGGSGGWIRLYGGSALPILAGATFDTSGGVGGDSSSLGGGGGDGADGRLESGMRPLCSDSIQNFDETDVDCGGSSCAACTLGEMCAADSDCPSTGACLDGVCQLATCGNSTMDGMETDVDCGGPECAPCADGLMCTADTDCSGTGCDTSACVSCTDSTQNDEETDVDCGGSECSTCDDGDMCAVDGDCTSGACESNLCVSCTDGAQNQDETDVDCGGSTCGACPGGSGCTVGTDCLSGTCDSSSTCTTPMFTDDFEAGPPLGTAWSTSGDANWFVSTTSPIAGSFSAESGDIADNELATLELTVTCGAGATVEFTYRTDTEDGWDYLYFQIDGVDEASWSGVSGPTTVSYPLTAGVHALGWEYDKDGSTSSGTDTVWIDDVTITGCVP